MALTIKKVIRLAGGQAALAHKLGPPVNSFVVGIWVRNGYVPAEYRRAVAVLIDCTVAQLIPPEPEEGKPKHRGVARAYAGMFHAVGLRQRKAAKLHQVSVDQIERWLSGHDEAPTDAFMDVHAYASGRLRMQENLTVEQAMKLTGLNQSGIASLAGVARPMATRWKAAGNIPLKHAKRIMGSIGRA